MHVLTQNPVLDNGSEGSHNAAAKKTNDCAAELKYSQIWALGWQMNTDVSAVALSFWVLHCQNGELFQAEKPGSSGKKVRHVWKCRDAECRQKEGKF